MDANIKTYKINVRKDHIIFLLDLGFDMDTCRYMYGFFFLLLLFSSFETLRLGESSVRFYFQKLTFTGTHNQLKQEKKSGLQRE